MAKKTAGVASGVNNNNIIVYDFETGGLNPRYHDVVEIAAMAINPRKLEPYPEAVFVSLIRPPGDEKDWKIEQEALDINHKTIEMLRAAPAEEQVWKQFCSFVNKYNTGNSAWTAPIACGQNIKKFDNIFAERLCRKYKLNINAKTDEWELFNKMNEIDLYDITFMWFENCVEPVKRSMDTLRDFFGISKEGGHEALKDVNDTWAIVQKFMQLHRRLSPSIPFKGAFNRGE